MVPSTRWQVQEKLPEPGSGMAAVSYEGNIYVIGGQRGGQVSGRVEVYQPDTATWTVKNEKPTPVKAAGAVLLGEKIYLPGGLSIDGEPVTDLEIYDPRTDQWSEGTPMPIPMSGYELAAFEGQMYVFGGWTGSEFSSRVFVYSPREDTWQELQPMASPQAGSSAVVIGTKILWAGAKTISDKFQV
jgi:N-acetylneuraminic acid mutarotase